MQRGAISRYFAGAAAKILSAGEVDPRTSNQHEFGGVVALKALFGEEKQTIAAQFLFLTDDENESTTANGFLTWYDARKNQPHRAAEYRFYFPASPVIERAKPGDLLIIAKRGDGTALVLIAPHGQSIGRHLLWLFDLPAPSDKFNATLFDGTEPHLNFAANRLLETIGIDTDIPVAAESQLDQIINRFGEGFPTTAEFSKFARETAERTSPVEDPDATIVIWLEHEEGLFRVLERHLVEQWLKSGKIDVDEFLRFSLSVHNRRKSRAGYAAENHLEAIFTSHDLKFSRTAKTEGKSRPDFLFPGHAEYHNPTFPTDKLAMLGVKTTCKDRWRQVLTEANRIAAKHLFTIEPGISADQTSEMQERDVQLVVPAALFDTFEAGQRGWLWNLNDFINHAKNLS